MENSEGVKVLGFWVSPFVMRVEWALKLKGVKNYEYIDEDVMYNKSPLLLELNPIYKKVPLLIHQGKVIRESFVILEYIDETWEQYHPLLPQDPYERARARFWANFGDDKLLTDAHVAMWAQGKDKERAVESSLEDLEKLEEEIKGKSFFGGKDIGYLDLALGWISYWLPVYEEVGSMKIMDPIKFPALTSWIHNFLNHSVIKDGLPPRDKMAVYYQERSIILASARYSVSKSEI